MRKLVISTFVSLDGVLQAPGTPDEDPTGGFEHGGWTFHYWDDVMMQAMGEAMAAPFDLLLGRRTYEIFAAHWPYAGDDPAARPLNAATKYVVSTTLRELTWGPAQLITGDVPAEIARLKEQDGPDLQVNGSSVLVQTLLAHGLADELRVWTFPVVLGKGKRLFGSGAVPAGFTLADSKASTTGVVMTTYRPAGPVKLGTFATQEPTQAELERRRKLAAEEMP